MSGDNNNLFHHNNVDEESATLFSHHEASDTPVQININNNNTNNNDDDDINNNNINSETHNFFDCSYERVCGGAEHNEARKVAFFVLILLILLSIAQNEAALLILFSALLVSFALMIWLRRRMIQHQRNRIQNGRNHQELVRLLREMGVSPAHARLSVMDRDFDGNDYDTLMRLDEEHKANRFTGLPQSEIERLPVYTVTESMLETDDVETASKQHLCSICLEKYAVGDKVRTVQCLHNFHMKCLDKWLRSKAQCPICNFRVTTS